MGACSSKLTEEQKKGLEANRAIEKDIVRRKREMLKEVRLLLLGTGASGKSTIAKQMQIIYLKGWGDQEREDFKPIIYSNLVENIQSLINGVKKLQCGSISDPEMAQELLELDPKSIVRLTEKQFNSILYFWREDPAIAEVFKRRNEIQLSDSAEYFFSRMEKYANMPTYKVTDEDILRIRVRTTGIIETDFTIGDYHFQMVDVGGQRNERKKWIHCFEDVTAVVFVASLSEYDQVLEEDNSTNRMKESLHLFEETVNNEWFRSTPVLLFLNKNDIFEQKAVVTDLGDYFPEYNGGKSIQNAYKFICAMYTERNHSPKQEREFYVHATIATNTKNILTLFDTVQDIFLSRAISGFIL